MPGAAAAGAWVVELPEAGTAVAGAGIVVDGTVFVVAATDDGGAGAGAVAAVIASAVGLGATGTDEDAGFFADESTVEAAAAMSRRKILPRRLYKKKWRR